jgi:hypothetical protein
MFNYLIKFWTFFILVSFALSYNSLNCFAQNEGSDVDVLRLDGNKTTSTIKKSSSDDQKAFTDKIKVMRVSEGEWDVFFELNGGPFSIPAKMQDNDTYQDIFQKAYDSKAPLQVTVNTDKGLIVSVKKSVEAGRLPASNSGIEQLPEKYKYLEEILKKHTQSPTN